MVYDRLGKRKFDGQFFCFYLLFYGIGRAWIEGLRTDSLYIGSTGIRVSQALSAVLVMGSLVYLFIRKSRGYDSEKMHVNRVKAEAKIESET